MKKTIKAMGRKEFIALMACLTALNALAIDMLLPAFSDIRHFFNLPENDGRISFIVLVYFVGMAIGQIFYGAFADSFGRKKMVYIALFGYIIGAAGAVLSPSLSILIFFRFLQGLGAAGLRVLSVTIIRDYYKGRAMAEIMSFVMSVFMLIPILAPSFGQVILQIMPWQALFAFFIISATLIGLWVAFRLPESLAPEQKRPLALQDINQALWQVLKDPMALGYTLVTACVFGTLTFFLSAADDLYQSLFHIKGFQFTLSFAAMAIFMGIASLLNTRLVYIFGIRATSQVAVFSFLVVSSLLTIFSALYQGHPPFILFFIFFSILFFIMPLVFANSNTLAMENMEQNIGMAASVIGFGSTILAAFIGGVIHFFFTKYNSLTPISIIYIFCSLIPLIIIFKVEKNHIFRLKKS